MKTLAAMGLFMVCGFQTACSQTITTTFGLNVTSGSEGGSATVTTTANSGYIASVSGSYTLVNGYAASFTASGNWYYFVSISGSEQPTYAHTTFTLGGEDAYTLAAAGIPPQRPHIRNDPLGV